MKIYIELSSLEEGREALEALTLYKEAGHGEMLFRKTATEAPEPVKEKAAEVPAPVREEETEAQEPAEEKPAPVYPSLTEVREAVKALQEAVGKEETKKLLAEFGAKGASSVDEEVREAFIKKAEVMING